jgi:hypothetical protein
MRWPTRNLQNSSGSSLRGNSPSMRVREVRHRNVLVWPTTDRASPLADPGLTCDNKARRALACDNAGADAISLSMS